MPIYQVVILAIVQGLTEFLPISSSAHLALAPWLLGWKDQGLSFDIALHFGTLVAILIYFFRDWVQVVAQGFGLAFGTDPQLKQNRSLLWMLALGSIPIGVFGLAFQHKAETTLRNPYVIGTMLILIGVLMGFAERVARLRKNLAGLSFLDAILVGTAQALAIVPGTSRSGITITAGLFRDFDRESAARFSFLLSTPAIAAAALKDFWDLRKHGGLPAAEAFDFLLGMAVSAVVGLFVIAFFLRYLRSHSLRFFVYYRIIFGIIVIALAAFVRPFSG